MKKGKLAPKFKLWFKGRRSHTFGEGGARLLEAIERFGSITRAAERVGCSYKYAWDKISEMEKAVGHPVVKTVRGGAYGGG
ncbi:MAG: LysR family transcriptional regulator, partial [Candidatus Bathyarchaeia archaeon]